MDFGPKPSQALGFGPARRRAARLSEEEGGHPEIQRREGQQLVADTDFSCACLDGVPRQTALGFCSACAGSGGRSAIHPTRPYYRRRKLFLRRCRYFQIRSSSERRFDRISCRERLARPGHWIWLHLTWRDHAVGCSTGARYFQNFPGKRFAHEEPPDPYHCDRQHVWMHECQRRTPAGRERL